MLVLLVGASFLRARVPIQAGVPLLGLRWWVAPIIAVFAAQIGVISGGNPDLQALKPGGDALSKFCLGCVIQAPLPIAVVGQQGAA